LKSASSEFVTMRGLAMRFRGILRSKNAKRLDGWLNDAQRSGIYAMQRFARTLRQDICAVRNAVAEPWSNGDRLKIGGAWVNRVNFGSIS
jgi:transposase